MVFHDRPHGMTWHDITPSSMSFHGTVMAVPRYHHGGTIGCHGNHFVGIHELSRALITMSCQCLSL